tara:strand:- start:298 stop:837 length:540 start_codon:yes stop_codon:yes gene_type:complete
MGFSNNEKLFGAVAVALVGGYALGHYSDSNSGKKKKKKKKKNRLEGPQALVAHQPSAMAQHEDVRHRAALAMSAHASQAMSAQWAMVSILEDVRDDTGTATQSVLHQRFRDSRRAAIQAFRDHSVALAAYTGHPIVLSVAAAMVEQWPESLFMKYLGRNYPRDRPAPAPADAILCLPAP